MALPAGRKKYGFGSQKGPILGMSDRSIDNFLLTATGENSGISCISGATRGVNVTVFAGCDGWRI